MTEGSTSAVTVGRGSSSTAGTQGTGSTVSTAGESTGGPRCDGPLLEPDMPCSTFEDTCPVGYKCAPYYRDEDGWVEKCAAIATFDDCYASESCVWLGDSGGSCVPHPKPENATRCVPVVCDATGTGLPCSAPDYLPTGLDDCDAGLMCVKRVPTDSEGICVPFCVGTVAAPGCDDPCRGCLSMDELHLCPPVCDPLAQDCPNGDLCVGTHSDGGGVVFQCVIGASGGDLGGVDEPCEYANVCDPGSFCAPVELVPECIGSVGCCALYCDVGDPAACQYSANTICMPLPDEVLGGCLSSEVGMCAIP